MTIYFKILENENMRRAVISLGLVFICFTLFAQKASFESTAVNVEITVRVLDGNRFVDNLTIDDFGIYEDGKLQQVQALYLFNKTQIRRREEIREFSPSQQRHFYLFFEISKYSSQIENAVDNFTRNILSLGDSLTIVTPSKIYKMKSETLRVFPQKELSRQISQILRDDVLSARVEYKNIFRDIENVARALHAFQSGNVMEVMRDPATGRIIELDQDGLMIRYMSLLKILEEMRKVNEERLIGLAQLLKGQEGQKDIFFFYQREFIPLVEPQLFQAFSKLSVDSLDFSYSLSYLNEFLARDLAFDVERIKRAFIDSNTAFHFLFFSRPQKKIPGLNMIGESGKMFESLKEIAATTGGLVDSSDKPGLLFQNKVEVLDNYYLLYYSPKDYKADGNFRDIVVKVKNKDYSVSYRKGYFTESRKTGEK